MTASVSLNGSAPALAAAPAAGSDRARLAEAARQFEAIFLRQMLAAADKADFGGEELFGGQGEETFREMRDARFAEVASSTGAIGLAASIEAQLARFVGPEG
jgi:flagellar protein FlgJ